MSYADPGKAPTGSTKNENPGTVTSDSLAAESINEGGSFGANSDSRGPGPQPSASTNTNNTDVSGARTLAPAVDAQAREAEAEWSESSQMQAGSQLGGTSGNENTRPSTYAGAAGAGDDIPDVGKPAGAKITEGGFDAGAPNASFGTDIGGKNDPGRVALGTMQAADVPVSGGAGARQQQIDGGTSFDQLGGDTEA